MATAGRRLPGRRRETTLEGVALENANGESCGGTLVASFAHSCNSVFAPLGARARRASGSSTSPSASASTSRPAIPGAATSTIPAADEIGDDLAVGSSAIGQGRVQATALQMATRRRDDRACAAAAPSRRCGSAPTPRFARVTRPRVARDGARG